MTRWLRALLALTMLAAGSALAGPVPTASAAPPPSAGVGRVIADLGLATSDTKPGFSQDGAYYAYLSPAAEACDLHLYDLKARKPVELVHDRVPCDPYSIQWAADTDTLLWHVDAPDDEVTVYVWDARPGRVSRLASDAHVFDRTAVSADGRFLSFTGRSDTHPAPGVDDPRHAAYVHDRTTGVSLPLSKPDLHVQLIGWSPRGDHFVAQTGGHTSYDAKNGACLGTGTSCHNFTRVTFNYGAPWSRDGSAVIGGTVLNQLYDFTERRFMDFPGGFVGALDFIGGGAGRLVGYVGGGARGVWDRTRGTVVKIQADAVFPSPTGAYLLTTDPDADTFRYLNLTSGATAPATLRGAGPYGRPPGFWTEDGSSYLGVGPGGCTSLRQWSPATNTVSLFGPPGPGTCFESAAELGGGPLSSASGRFALVAKRQTGGVSNTQYYVADLRRHVLTGPLSGGAGPFAPAGSDSLVVRQPLDAGATRLLLVDPTPVPDVDDKPRWSAATPATGARVSAKVGDRVHVPLGASDLQGTPVNLYFRWRDTAGTPIRSAPKGWSCERKRLAAGATVADCTFAPPKDHTAARYLDVSATNFATGAQSDTRSYRVGVGT